MNIKGYLYILLIFLVLISASAVSAADEQTSDIISADDDNELILDEIIMDDVSTSDNDNEDIILDENNDDEILESGDETPTGTFAQLNQAINDNNDATITLNSNYKYSEGDESFIHGINISRELTINGNGYTLDGSHIASIFYVDDRYEVTFKDINFINGNATGSGNERHGGAISVRYGNGIAENCNFTNNTASCFGGAMNGGSAYNCIFSLSFSEGDGGAIYMGSAFGCTFTNNSASGVGGAMHQSSAFNCTFTGNSAEWDGGAMYDGSAFNCTFTGNSASGTGGAMYEGSAFNCTFILNSASNEKGDDTWSTECDDDCTFIVPQFSVSDFTSTYDSGEKLLFNLTYENQNYDDFNTTIKVYQNDALIGTYYALSGENGGWIVNLTEGIYHIALSLERFSKVNEAMATINIISNSTTISASNITATYNHEDYLVVTLLNSEGKPINNSQISVDLNEETVNYTTNENGQIEVPIKGLLPNTYIATLSYAGNDTYEGSSTTAKVTVNKINTKLTASKVTATYNVNKYLLITLKDASGNVLANKKVSVKVGSIAKDPTTNAKGQVSVLISKIVPKTYAASISFAGDSYYNKSSAKATVVVKKASPKLTAKAKTFKVKVKVKKYTITLKNNNGKVMKNTKVTLKVNKKTFTARTNKKGVATFKITNLKKKGKFTAVIKYAGSKYYNKLTKKARITVKK